MINRLIHLRNQMKIIDLLKSGPQTKKMR